ncbi:rhamnulokinase [Psychrobacillus psychrodurans]|uniref:rhamnulokinase n=1 Tax=Psychrobacillus psychrodurans TaxID=126157 RepID=UPI001F4D408D|nr:rhamnulokinase family protein [Psychrobacillus psychrodurans]MCK1995773.1 rhamnulokinase [Psychrobacillus psychrodurans]
MTTVLAYDLGASSGRLVAQTYTGQTLTMNEIHRFQNKPVHENNHYYWDYRNLVKELNQGFNKVTSPAKSLGIDTWGVDFGLLNKTGQLVSKPFSYRDTHSVQYVQQATKQLPPQTLFEQTGNEISAINTLFQLMAIQSQYPQYLTETTDILMLPNLLIHALSGVKLNEFTIASTSQLVNKNQQWDKNIQQTFFNQTLPFAPIEMPHRMVGTIKNHPSIQMALVPGHDTACALSALPIQRPNALFISIGTWGLIGKEIKEPITTAESFQQSFTNEGTSEGQYRFQKNAMGFWILQKCREEWKQQGIHFTYEQEINALQQAKSFNTFIDPDDDLFFNPVSMLQAIKKYCLQTNQQVPITPGEHIRCFIESLAIKYAYTIKQIEKITNTKTTDIYIGGGGTQNTNLCQFIANASNKIVHTGPTEASSIGNGLSQLRALGELHSIEEGRQLVANSFEMKQYEPQHNTEWQEAIDRFQQLLHM